MECRAINGAFLGEHKGRIGSWLILHCIYK